MLIMIKGAGDLASGIALRLWSSGFSVVMTEQERPTVVRRKVSFAEAVYEGQVQVEGITGALAQDAQEARVLLEKGIIPVLVDGKGLSREALAPQVIIDATLAKRNLGTYRGQAPLVIGCGPGFTAGDDVDLVVETKRGHYLGRVIREGSAQPNTGIPGIVNGYGEERVLRAVADGKFVGLKEIGDFVRQGEQIGEIGNEPLYANITGVLRGLLRSGLSVWKGMKVGDIDPRGEVQYCFTVSDKALALGGAALEAILGFMAERRDQE